MKTVSLLTLLLVGPALPAQEDAPEELPRGEASVPPESASEAPQEKAWTPKFRVQLLLTPNGEAKTEVVKQLVSVTRLVPHDTAGSRRIAGQTIGAAYKKVEELQETGTLVKSPGSLEIHCDSVDVSMTSSGDEDTVSLEVAGKARISLPGFATIECSSAKLSEGKLVLKEAKTLGAAFKFSASELTFDVKPLGVKTTRFGQEGDQVESADTPSPVPDAAFEAAPKPREFNRGADDPALRRSDYRSFPPARPEQ
ncbi:MAG: hypothetical protein NXI04_16360 [Planctomycetaceae bacterium]|nr:hypothetical protein [Planctomycetaceae bacterium]